LPPSAKRCSGAQIHVNKGNRRGYNLGNYAIAELSVWGDNVPWLLRTPSDPKRRTRPFTHLRCVTCLKHAPFLTGSSRSATLYATALMLPKLIVRLLQMESFPWFPRLYPLLFRSLRIYSANRKKVPKRAEQRGYTLWDSRTHARPVGGARDKKYLFWNDQFRNRYILLWEGNVPEGITPLFPF